MGQTSLSFWYLWSLFRDLWDIWGAFAWSQVLALDGYNLARKDLSLHLNQNPRYIFLSICIARIELSILSCNLPTAQQEIL